MFANIATTIINDARLNQKFLSHADIGYLALLKAWPISQEDLENKVHCWVERLYIANALAYQYNYSREFPELKIPRLEEKDLNGSLIPTNKELLKQLESLKYNLFTNAGNCFLSEEDMDKLDRMTSLIRQNLEMRLEGWE